MGFEQVVPPIPDRRAELEGISRLEKNWLSQPYWKYYMNESLRQPKLAYSERINTSYSRFYFYFAASVIGLIPVSLLCRRFFIKRSNLPITFNPDYFGRERSDNHVRSMKYLKVMVPVHLLASIALGIALTDWEIVFFDQKYEFLHKTPKMM